MWLNELYRHWLGRTRTVRRGPRRDRRVRCVRLGLEGLEDRTVPSTFAPTTFRDGISGGSQVNTLRDAVNASNSDTGHAADTIQLSAGTYTLDLGELHLTNSSHALIIQGGGTTGANATIIDQTIADRVFQIAAAGAKVEFENLVIEGGDATNDGTGASGPTNARGGGILNNGGKVTLSNVVVQFNQAAAGAGLNAYGGGVYSSGGSLTISGSSFAYNSAYGGAGTAGANGTSAHPTGGNGGNGGAASGGGMYAANDTLQLTKDGWLGNRAFAGGGGSGATGNFANGGSGGSGSGGGLYVTGSNATLSHNTATTTMPSAATAAVSTFPAGPSTPVTAATPATVTEAAYTWRVAQSR